VTEALEFLRSILESIPHGSEIALHTRKALLAMGGMFVVVYVLEALAGADKKRYLSRNFINDFVYCMFYRSGIYVFFIYLPIMNLLGPYVTLSFLEGIPLPLLVVLHWLLRDFLTYWTHRAQHSVPFLWEFHKIHHSQSEMTFLTTSRFHIVDQLTYHVVMVIPLLLIFGKSPGMGFAVYVISEFHLFVQHSHLKWKYGPLHKILVSPAFHAVHHSSAPEHHGKNFGMYFSFWDFIFGTAIRTDKRPEQYGLPDWNAPESFLRQLVWPIRSLMRGRSKTEPEPSR